MVLIAMAFAGGFGWFAEHISRLTTPQNLPNADAIIVLTGGQARIDAALGLLKSGKGKRLLISGANPIADRSSLQAATGGDKSLFSCCVDIDYAALDTIGNAEESAKWVRSIVFLEGDKPGYWEVRGYHNYGDPWLEQRYDEEM